MNKTLALLAIGASVTMLIETSAGAQNTPERTSTGTTVVSAGTISLSPQFIAGQLSMRRDIGLGGDEATVSRAVRDVDTVRSSPQKETGEISNVRANLYLTVDEAAKFDAYARDAINLEKIKGELLGKIGTKATWIRVNNNVSAPGVEVGVLGNGGEVAGVVQTYLPAGWTVTTWPAKSSWKQSASMAELLRPRIVVSNG